MKFWQSPAEVKVVAGLLVGIGLVHTLLGVIIVSTSEASGRTVMLPITALVLGSLVAAGLALRMPSSRIAGFAVVVIFAILHVLVLMAGELLWLKLFSGLAAAGYVYTGVLLNSMPVRRFLLGERA
ncbi:hypothetical protein [Amycolatopsis anabasis]|uniref:hypothetical protein n=1 Tax=Amycolatopsis anabasis TaxID=1840409 RepID=UPI00131ABC05|nr:hypothetical protein [Amycolatopsis anabasis]